MGSKPTGGFFSAARGNDKQAEAPHGLGEPPGQLPAWARRDHSCTGGRQQTSRQVGCAARGWHATRYGEALRKFARPRAHTHTLIVRSGQKCATRRCHARSAAGVPPPALRHWSVFRNRPYPRSCPACARSPQPVPLQQTAANVAQWPARWLGEPSVAGSPPTPRGRSRSCPLTPPRVRRAGATSQLVATPRARVPPVHRANGGNM